MVSGPSKYSHWGSNKRPGFVRGECSLGAVVGEKTVSRNDIHNEGDKNSTLFTRAGNTVSTNAW